MIQPSQQPLTCRVLWVKSAVSVPFTVDRRTACCPGQGTSDGSNSVSVETRGRGHTPVPGPGLWPGLAVLGCPPYSPPPTFIPQYAMLTTSGVVSAVRGQGQLPSLRGGDLLLSPLMAYLSVLSAACCPGRRSIPGIARFPLLNLQSCHHYYYTPTAFKTRTMHADVNIHTHARTYAHVCTHAHAPHENHSDTKKVLRWLPQSHVSDFRIFLKRLHRYPQCSDFSRPHNRDGEAGPAFLGSGASNTSIFCDGHSHQVNVTGESLVLPISYTLRLSKAPCDGVDCPRCWEVPRAGNRDSAKYF